MEPRLSIIIPTFNEEKYLPRLIDSITSQSLRPHEIIVADAWSEDDTRTISRVKGCKVIDGARHPGKARNRGAQAASGDLLLFLDADVVLDDRDFLQESVKEFRKKKLAAAGFSASPIEEKRLYRMMMGVYNTTMPLARHVCPYAIGAAILVKREIHNRLGFSDKAGEDLEYARKVSRIGRFGMLQTRVSISMRRYEKYGALKTVRDRVVMAGTNFFAPRSYEEIDVEFGKF